MSHTMPARQQIQHQVSRIRHLSELPGPAVARNQANRQYGLIADLLDPDMVRKLLILKRTNVLDDIKHTSKDDKVDLPHPLVPHKSIVTDSFLSLILIGTVGKENKEMLQKRKDYQLLSGCFGVAVINCCELNTSILLRQISFT